jgi:hypothetical protein
VGGFLKMRTDEEQIDDAGMVLIYAFVGVLALGLLYGFGVMIKEVVALTEFGNFSWEEYLEIVLELALRN